MVDDVITMGDCGTMGLHQKAFRAFLNATSPQRRKARMAAFVEKMELKPGLRVIDLGGSTKLWRFVDVPLDITVLNLATQWIDESQYGSHRFTIVRGDATNAPEIPDNSYDLVFSNSCIEHVGPREKQKAFADTVRRLAPAYWVQTPSKLFPIEAHTGLPFWWYYPESVRNRIIGGWKKSVPEYGEFVDGTRVLPRKDIEAFFPDSKIDVEKVAGFTKSYIAWRKAN